MLLLVLMTLGLVLSLNADDLQQTVEQLSDDAARRYVNPIVTAFGTNMNGGWYHSAPKARFLKLDLELGFVLMFTPFSSMDETFNVNGHFNFTRQQAEQLAVSFQSLPVDQYEALIQQIMNQNFVVGIFGPTVIGKEYDPLDPDNTAINIQFPEQDIIYSYQGGSESATIPQQKIVLPVGGLLEDVPILPLIVPQITIGTVAGTQVTFRYLSDSETTKELGKTKYFGFGVQHNPVYWSPIPIPVDVALALYTQKLELGSVVTAKASSFGVNVSKTFGVKFASFTPYAGANIESSNMEFKYQYVLDNSHLDNPIMHEIKFDVDGENKSRLVAGASFRLGVFNLNFDYNIAEYPSVTVGTMFNFSW